uniref:Uncharacterized protein n=1 Tax=Ditylenchus dipsaci TaxID=166011 RepID=A0A915CMH5_9BILA
MRLKRFELVPILKAVYKKKEVNADGITLLLNGNVIQNKKTVGHITNDQGYVDNKSARVIVLLGNLPFSFGDYVFGLNVSPEHHTASLKQKVALHLNQEFGYKFHQRDIGLMYQETSELCIFNSSTKNQISVFYLIHFSKYYISRKTLK